MRQVILILVIVAGVWSVAWIRSGGPWRQPPEAHVLAAADCGDTAALRVALDRHPKSLTYRDPYGQDALCHAVIRRQSGVIKILLEAGAPADRVYCHNFTALIMAVSNDNVEAVEELLRHGAPVNAATEHGTTALMVAAECASPEIVFRLLACGADPSPRDAFGDTALDLARAHSNGAECARLLIEARPPRKGS